MNKKTDVTSKSVKILVLDNYDSFTYNLVHILKYLTKAAVEVFRNDEITLKEIDRYDKILISPGPGVPDQAGITKEMISHYATSKSILGVCLGCQAIAEVFGGNLINLDTVFHGIETKIIVLEKNEKLFKDIPGIFTAGRYHSWVVNGENLPDTMMVTAKDEPGSVMALSHKTLDVRGVQFHPESIMTKCGCRIIQNWLNI